MLTRSDRSQSRSQSRSLNKNPKNAKRSKKNPPVPNVPPILMRSSAKSVLKRYNALPPSKRAENSPVSEFGEEAEEMSGELTTELLDAYKSDKPDSLEKVKLTPEIEELIRQDSTGVTVNSNGVTVKIQKGTTSCRHLQVLYLSFPLMKLFPEPHNRQLLSKIWNTAVKVSSKLDKFYTWNEAMAMPYEELETIPTSDGVYPMGLVINKGTHVCHYFLLLIEYGIPYIYSAYGSDYVRMYPKKTRLNKKDFSTFIEAVNTYNKDSPDKYDNDCRDETNQAIIDKFITEYFLNSGDGDDLTYIDEGDSEGAEPRKITEEEGIDMELKTYLIPFKVIHFDKVQQELKNAVEGITEGRFEGGKRKKRRTKRIRLKLKK